MYLNRLNMKCFFSTRQKQANNSQFPPHHTCELMITSHTFDMFSWIWCPVFDLSSKCVQVPVDILQESFSSSSGQGTCLQKQFSPFWLKHKSTLNKVPLKDISISFTVSIYSFNEILQSQSHYTPSNTTFMTLTIPWGRPPSAHCVCWSAVGGKRTFLQRPLAR